MSYSCQRCSGALDGPHDRCWCAGGRTSWGANARRLIEGRRAPAATGFAFCARCGGQVRSGGYCICGVMAPSGRLLLTGDEAAEQIAEKAEPLPLSPADALEWLFHRQTDTSWETAMSTLRRRYVP